MFIGNIRGDHGHPFVGLVEPYLFLVQKVDYAFKLILGSHREEQRHRICSQLCLDIINNCKEIGTHPVHLVHKCDSGHLILFCLLPYSLGLGLDPAHCAEYGNTAVQNP